MYAASSRPMSAAQVVGLTVTGCKLPGRLDVETPLDTPDREHPCQRPERSCWRALKATRQVQRCRGIQTRREPGGRRFSRLRTRTKGGCPAHIPVVPGAGRAKNDGGKQDACIVRNQSDWCHGPSRRCHELFAESGQAQGLCEADADSLPGFPRPAHVLDLDCHPGRGEFTDIADDDLDPALPEHQPTSPR